MQESVSRWEQRWIFWLLVAIAVAVGMHVNFAGAAELDKQKPLPPDVVATSGEASQSMAGIRIPDGWEIHLFAAEPDVANIVAFDIDRQGRIYVCESFRQNRGVTDNRSHDEAWVLADLASVTVQDRIDYHNRLLGEAALTYSQHDDRIRRVSDTDGDGVADESVVVADGFNGLEEGTGAGVLARGNEVFYTCIPKLWKLRDKDGDGGIDERVALSDGFGVRVAFRGHDLHGLLLGPDGRLYFSIGDRGYNVTTKENRVLADPASGAVFRCELDGSGMEVYARGLRNPQELAFNDLGDLFTVDNNSDSGDKARVVHLLEGGDSGWRMYYQYLIDRGPFTREGLWKPFHEQQPAYIVPPIANLTDGPSGLAFYPGTGFGDQLKNKFFVCDFRGGPADSGVRSFQLEADGAFYKLTGDDQPVWSCLATDVAFGPEGGMYVSDWVDGWEGLGKGRIYRLSNPEYSDSDIVMEVATLLKADWSDRPTEDLAGDLAHADRRIRLEAQWQLAERSEHPALLDIARKTDQPAIARLHAVWGVEQIARKDTDKAPAILASLRPLLGDGDATIRAAATKVLGERGDQESTESLRSLLKDPSARVRYFAAHSLGKLKDESALSDVVSMLEENDNQDPALRHAGIYYLSNAAKGSELAKLSAHASVSVRRAAVAALRRMKSGDLIPFLADKNPLVVTEAAIAIHDEPIPVAMGALAAMIDGDVSLYEVNTVDETGAIIDTPLTRRVLNANYRAGTDEAAKRIAEFTTRLTAPVPMKLEAMEMLGAWKTPDPRDRVLNDYRPLDPRDSSIAAKALEEQIDALGDAKESVREKMIDVASRLGIKKIIPLLADRIINRELRSEQRGAALIALARLNDDFALKLAKKIPLAPATALVPAALKVMADHDRANSIPTFIEATKSPDDRVRQLAWDVIATTKDPRVQQRIGEGVRSFIDGNLPPDVHLNVLDAASKQLSGELLEELKTHREKLSDADPLAPWLPSLEGGDVGKGAQLFFGKTELSCVRCHKVDRAGGEVGPNLTVIGKQRDRRYLLESICLPDAQIAKGYETAVIADDAGDVVTGIVRTETDEYIELIEPDGSLKRILQGEIEFRRRGKSAMPADLLKHLSGRELRDLVAYLSSLRIDPRADTE